MADSRILEETGVDAILREDGGLLVTEDSSNDHINLEDFSGRLLAENGSAFVDESYAPVLATPATLALITSGTAKETFTDVLGTALTAHAGEYAGTWAPMPSTSAIVPLISSAGRLRANIASSSGSRYYGSTPYASDYDVSAKVHYFAVASGFWTAAVYGRIPSERSGLNGYAAEVTFQFGDANPTYNLRRYVGGAGTVLGTASGAGFVVGGDRQITLRVAGDAISMLVAGVVVVGPITDTTFASGNPGLQVSSSFEGPGDTSGFQLDDWQVSSPAAVGPVIGLAVSPPLLAIATSAFAPSVAAGSGTVAVPGLLAAAAAGFAPVVALAVSPGLVALSASPLAPTVGGGVVPATIALATASSAPAANLAVLPGLATLATSGLAPVVALAVSPATIALASSAFVPAVGAGVVPGLVALATAGLAPAIGGGVVPGLRALATAGLAPRLDLVVSPPTSALATSGLAPAPDLTVVPGVVALATSGRAPVAALAVSPGLVALAAAGLAPVLALAVVPGAAALTTSGLAPSLSAAVAVVVPTAALIASGLAPTTDLAVRPGTRALATARLAPTVLAPRLVVPGVRALSLSSAGAVVRLVVAPAAAALATVRLAPSVAIAGPRLATPPTLALATARLAPSVRQDYRAVPAPLAIATATAAPAVLVARTISVGPAPLVLTGLAPDAIATAFFFRVRTYRATIAPREPYAAAVRVRDRTGLVVLRGGARAVVGGGRTLSATVRRRGP